MSNNQQYGYNQNHHGQGGASGQHQQSDSNQSTAKKKGMRKSLWDTGGRLPPSVAPSGTTIYQPQQTPHGGGQRLTVTNPITYQPQQTSQRTEGQFSQPAAPQPSTVTQRSHPGGHGLQPQAVNVVQPQQAVFNPQSHQQYRFRTPITPSNQQQFQTGNASGSVGVGRGVPSFGPGAGTISWFRTDPFQQPATGRNGKPDGSKGKAQRHR